MDCYGDVRFHPTKGTEIRRLNLGNRERAWQRTADIGDELTICKGKMPDMSLCIAPEIQAESEDTTSLLRDTYEHLQSKRALFIAVAEPNNITKKAFIAPTPDDAVRWICERV